MAESSKIEWTKSTFNPWIGCTKVSPGCDHCYAEVSTPSRAMKIAWGAGQQRHRTGAANWNQVKAWNAAAAKTGEFWPVFSASLADIFDNEVPEEWRNDFWALVRQCPALTFQVLTKRIGNAKNMLPADWGDGYKNVWLISSIVNQPEADRDIDKLLAIPAAVHGLSMEPLLGPVNIREFMWPTHWAWDAKYRTPEEALAAGAFAKRERQALVSAHARFLDWVIVGGESGHQARPMHPQWARDIRDQCAAAGVPFLFKQWGEWSDIGNPGWVPHGLEDASDDLSRHQFIGGANLYRIGKKAAGRLLDHVQHDGYPKVAP